MARWQEGEARGGLPPAPPAGERPPVPWHFKLMAGAIGVYVALRIVQMLSWIGVTVKEIHLGIAVALIAVNAIAAGWGLLAWWRGLPLFKGYRAIALVGWYLFVPQLALGAALYGNHHRAPTGWQHYIYGVAAVLAISAGAFYRRRLHGRDAMLYGLVALFLMGIAIRALITGRG